MTPSRSTLALPELSLTLWHWGRTDAPPLVLIHGWGDSGATFQFVAAALAEDFHVVAPDLRGFGESQPAPGGYWFPDYLRDVEAVLAAVGGERPVVLVGHSMGGNVCGLYAGIRPARVGRLVLLEGFGMPPTTPEEAPSRYARWLDGLTAAPVLRDFADESTLHRHLQRLAPKAPAEVIATLAPRWADRLPDGAYRLRMDPLHKGVHPVLYRREEAVACWQATTAPVTLVAGGSSDYLARFTGFDPMADCARHYREARCHTLPGIGHMLHWEAPGEVADLIREAASRA